MTFEQTEADWWKWAYNHLSYKPPEQLEHAARHFAFTYRWGLSKERVVAKLLGQGTVER